MKEQDIQYYDRETGELCRERVMGEGFVRWAYETVSGRICSPLVFGNSLLSRFLGWYFDCGMSKARIPGTIRDLDIDVSEFAEPPDSFTSFNDFFTRRLREDARRFDASDRAIVSPADGRILVYGNAIESTRIRIKGIDDTVDNLFRKQFPEFSGGTIAVIRLCPADYHRFHFPCDGNVVETGRVKGTYHSVNPIALDAERNVFCRNKREYSIFETVFGKVAMMEIGAFGVAGIVQTYRSNEFTKMQEKGYFKFGGSTVLLMFEPGRISLAPDLLDHSGQGYETLVKVGETIGTRSRSARL